MKKLILLITALVFHHTIFAQGVGINTTSPDPSAALDIQSTNKGILIPKVSLTSLIDKTTITAPANGLLVYNTNPNLKNGVGFYFNANTPVSPDWRAVSDWKLPYYGADSEPAAAFLIENYHGGSNSSAIKGYSAGSGTGVHARSDAGVALKAEGGVKIFGNGQAPGVGKVLTSDAQGNATWEGGVAFRASGMAGGGSEKIGKNIYSKIPFSVENYDIGNNYNNINGNPHNVFIAPVKGIYHFDVQVGWVSPDWETDNFVVLSIFKSKDGSSSPQVSSPFYSNGDNRGDVSVDLELEPGDGIYTAIFQSTFDYLDLTPHSYFCGRLVMKL
ncbi:C1q-like domain-containing protein [Dyadobacter pollutisoli]|uniref:C1q domain-containing protein n=1 Tax=Dyadobacter pollutisoli TaxID=2910158 RepID=A0A9E8SJX0_9BACT|nr:hypothetical protein [Dyadobacter pollutisoli]WAC11820.1 hypothetical protein ON006_29315 [Dyadobacter pollutisoli]